MIHLYIFWDADDGNVVLIRTWAKHNDRKAWELSSGIGYWISLYKRNII